MLSALDTQAARDWYKNKVGFGFRLIGTLAEDGLPIVIWYTGQEERWALMEGKTNALIAFTRGEAQAMANEMEEEGLVIGPFEILFITANDLETA